MTKIELKNIQHSEFASEETHCYEATLYVDGKRFAIVKNQGHGGCDDVWPIKPFTHEDVKNLEQRVREEYPKWGKEFGDEEDTHDTNLEIVCGKLVNEWLRDREIKKTLKKITFVESPGEKEVYNWGSIAQAKRIGDLIRERILRDYPTAIILNDLPIEEVRPYFS